MTSFANCPSLSTYRKDPVRDATVRCRNRSTHHRVDDVLKLDHNHALHGHRNLLRQVAARNCIANTRDILDLGLEQLQFINRAHPALERSRGERAGGHNKRRRDVAGRHVHNLRDRRRVRDDSATTGARHMVGLDRGGCGGDVRDRGARGAADLVERVHNAVEVDGHAVRGARVTVAGGVAVGGRGVRGRLAAPRAVLARAVGHLNVLDGIVERAGDALDGACRGEEGGDGRGVVRKARGLGGEPVSMGRTGARDGGAVADGATLLGLGAAAVRVPDGVQSFLCGVHATGHGAERA